MVWQNGDNGLEERIDLTEWRQGQGGGGEDLFPQNGIKDKEVERLDSTEWSQGQRG